MSALHLHLSCGITVAAFVFLRVLYKLWGRAPEEAPGTALEHLATNSTHRMRYAVMIVMPITGYWGTGADTGFFGLFQIPQFRDTALYEIGSVNGWA